MSDPSTQGERLPSPEPELSDDFHLLELHALPTASERRRKARWRMLKYIGLGLLALIICTSLIRAVFAPKSSVDESTSDSNAVQAPTSTHTVPWQPVQTDEIPTSNPEAFEEEDKQNPGDSSDNESTAGWILTLDSGHEAKEHVVITSNTTKDGHWFALDWGADYDGFNPNFVPHPLRDGIWYMLAVGSQSTLVDHELISGTAGPVYSVELYCAAKFVDGRLSCIKSPLQLPIASTTSPYCTGEQSGAYWIIGPGESRAFMGENGIPYVMFVSPSQYNCSGPHLQDLRRLVNWYTFDAINLTNPFFFPTDLQRPLPRNFVEKNWFVFWDQEGDMYLHYDISPKRAFAKMDADGSGHVSTDLAPLAAEHDVKCMQLYMPRPMLKERIHQCSNSLALTLCKRSDPTCMPSAENTFILAIFQHKKYYGHNLYEPYVVLFKNTAPFELHGIGSKPLWISGRGKPGWSDDPKVKGQSQMMYIQSINWKERGVGYHGYLDDVIMIAFGIEDKTGGGIDVVAEQLVREINICEH